MPHLPEFAVRDVKFLAFVQRLAVTFIAPKADRQNFTASHYSMPSYGIRRTA
jgi:hypothetical protein